MQTLKINELIGVRPFILQPHCCALANVCAHSRTASDWLTGFGAKPVANRVRWGGSQGPSYVSWIENVFFSNFIDDTVVLHIREGPASTVLSTRLTLKIKTIFVELFSLKRTRIVKFRKRYESTPSNHQLKEKNDMYEKP